MWFRAKNLQWKVRMHREDGFPLPHFPLCSNHHAVPHVTHLGLEGCFLPHFLIIRV